MRSGGGKQYIDIIAPVFNERDSVRPFLEEIWQTTGQLPPDIACNVIVVNDGSTDSSGDVLDACAHERPGRLKVIHFTRNFGVDAAIGAGLDASQGDAVIVLDADMQDDPAVFPEFVAKWRAGYDVVYGVRGAASAEPAFHRMVSRIFCGILGWLARVPLPADATNFALMDRRVVRAICALPEHTRFMRGLRAWVGFRQVGVAVARRPRYDHATRIGAGRQWRMAMNAFFAFSHAPLFVFRVAGATTLLLCAGLILWALWCKLTAVAPPAWTSIYITISYLGGVNLLGIGILGEYVARIHDEVKGRPHYVLDPERPAPPDGHST